MHSDDSGNAVKHAPRGEQDERKKTLKWLLDQDMAEPSDNLFRIPGGESISDDLTERETAVAGRPMFGGNASADDLSAFVGEEIVMSDEAGGNIYQDSESGGAGDDDTAGSAYGGIVAIDHRRQRADQGASDLAVEDGTDILGLMDDDDIGTQPLVLRRSRKTGPAESAAPEDNAATVASAAVPENSNAAGESTRAVEEAVEAPHPVEARESTAQRVERQFGALPPEPVDDLEDDANRDLAPIEYEMPVRGVVNAAAPAGSGDVSPVVEPEAVLPADTALAGADAAVAEDDAASFDLEDELAIDLGALDSDGELPAIDEAPADVTASSELPETDLSLGDGGWLSDGAVEPAPEEIDETLESALPELDDLPQFLDDVLPATDLDSLDTGDGDYLSDLEALSQPESEPDELPALLMDVEEEVESLATGMALDEQLPETLEPMSWAADDNDDAPSLSLEQDDSVGDLSAWQLDTTREEAPQFEELAPQLEETAPQLEETALQIEETAPRLEEIEPQIEETAPELLAFESEPGHVLQPDPAELLLEVSGENEVGEPAADDLVVELEVAAVADEQTTPELDEDVQSYVTRNLPPADDSEFDAYLLRGEHLDDAGQDFDSLAVERTEGVASVDPSLDSDVDYHQDFRLPEDFDPRAVAAITRALGPAMEQLSGFVAERLEALQLPADSVALDAMLATDPLSRSQCQSEGYSPVASVCPSLPDALSTLSEPELEALCVRLVFRDSGESCNDLLQPGYTPAVAETASDGATDTQWVAPSSGTVAASFDFDFGAAGTPGGFGLDAESANDAGEAAGEVQDSESWFDLGDDESEDSGLLALLDEVESGSDTELAEPVPADAPGALETVADSLENPAGPDSLVEQEPLADGAQDALPDAAPDIFSAADLDDWDADSGAGSDADVDALLESLAGPESDISDICGVAMDEFGSDSLEADEFVPGLAASAATPAPVSSPVDDELPPAAVDPENSADVAWCIPSNIRFSYSSQGGGEVFRDFLDAFLEEGAVELEKLEDAIGQWEQDIDSSAGSDIVPRVLHTLKGIAKGIGLQRYGTLIHNFETLLMGLARPAAGEEAAYFRIVNAWLDAAVQGFEHIQRSGNDVASELPQADKLVQPVVTEDAALSVDTASAVHQDVAPAAAPAKQRQQDKQLADEGAKVLAAQQTIRMTSEALDNLLNLNNQAQQLGVRASQSTFRSKRAGAELLARLSSVRSHITKIADRALQNVTARGSRLEDDLDALEMDQYSELQEAASILREAIEDLDDLIHVSSRQTASAEALLKQQGSVITSLGSAIRDARVVPIARLMPGLRRIVRTVGADLGKLVDFRVMNEIGKLDRDSHVCCQIILEHMVRNALDHGIEAPQQRREAGKPETGEVTIDVSKEGSDYLIRLSDDGRGMDPAALREAALDRGLDVNVEELSDREALRLIFHKGFSTASRLSEISGRGVGMDIVLSELQQIGGEIEIDSTPGRGTTFTVRVPSNVNVNGALMVKAGETSYAIPLDGLIAIEHVPLHDFYRAIGTGEHLELQEMSCEVAYLATLCHGDKLPDPGAWGQTVPVILAGSDERYMAIAVDDVAEALELVIRSMGAQFSQVPGVAGGATTSDGQAIVALDLNAMVRSLASRQLSSVPVEREKSERLLVLVVDDSRTQRMVATSQFDSLGVETVTAENGLVAIDLLNTTHRLPDVVLLDVEMPVKDGIQTLREIRKSARYKHLPVIMVTSRTGPKHRALAQEAGCNGYMGKPFNFPVLVEQIAQLTGHELEIN